MQPYFLEFIFIIINIKYERKKIIIIIKYFDIYFFYLY